MHKTSPILFLESQTGKLNGCSCPQVAHYARHLVGRKGHREKLSRSVKGLLECQGNNRAGDAFGSPYNKDGGSFIMRGHSKVNTQEHSMHPPALLITEPFGFTLNSRPKLDMQHAQAALCHWFIFMGVFSASFQIFWVPNAELIWNIGEFDNRRTIKWKTRQRMWVDISSGKHRKFVQQTHEWCPGSPD